MRIDSHKKKDKVESISNKKIAQYFGVEEKIVDNIFLMFNQFGRQSIKSIKLSDEQIDEIIKLKYPTISISSNNSTEILKSKIEELIFDTRVKNILKRNGIYAIEDLQKYTLKDIYRFRNMGEAGLESIIKAIKNKGLDPYKVFKEMDNYAIDYPRKINLKKLIEK